MRLFKYITSLMLIASTVFGADFTIANQEQRFNQKFLEIQEILQDELTIEVFNNTTIYKRNAALLGVLEREIDLAVVSNAFLQTITDERLQQGEIQGTQLQIFVYGKEYSLVAHKAMDAKFSNKITEKLLDTIHQTIKDF